MWASKGKEVDFYFLFFLVYTPTCSLKFNVDEATKGKSIPASMEGVLHKYKGEATLMLYKNTGVKDSNKAEVLAIQEALQIYSSHKPKEVNCEERLIKRDCVGF